MVAFFMAGCTIGPKYVKPTIPTPPEYKGNESKSIGTPGTGWSKAIPDDAAERGAWWVLFDDKELNVLEEKAGTANQNIKAAEASFRQARALVHQAKSGYYPTVQVGPRANLFTNPLSKLDIHDAAFPASLNQFTLQGTVAWEPDLWGRVRKQVEADVAAAQASAADIANVQLEIQTELASDYLQICGLDEELRLYRQTIANDERTLDLTREKQRSGVASDLDVKQAEAQLDGILTQAKDLAVQRAQFEDAIAVLIGVPAPSFTLAPHMEPVKLPRIPPGIPSELLQRRPDIAAAERQVAQANAQIGLAKSAYYPSLSLKASGGFTGTHLSDWFNWPGRVWALGSSATEMLFDGGSRKAQVAQAQAGYDATVANYRQSVITAFQEVQDNLAATQVLVEETVMEGNAVAASQASVALEGDRLQHGTASVLDVISAQNTLLSNEQVALSIHTRQLTSTVQLIKAVGGGWQDTQLPGAAHLH